MRPMTKPTILHRAPASFFQQLLVAGADEHGRDNTLNLVVALRIVGSFDRRAFDDAVRRLVDRHEALRTTLVAVDGGVEQVIWDALASPIDVLDVQSSPDTLMARLLEFADADMQLCGGPLFSALLITVGPAERVVALKMHHGISDGRSCAIIESDFRELYESSATGKPDRLSPLKVHFRHHVSFETCEIDPARRRYWEPRLSGDLSRTAQLVGEPSLLRRPWVWQELPLISAATVAALEDIAAEAHVSLATASLAAVSTVWAPSANKVTIGVSHENRFHPEFRDVVGAFTDTLPVQIDLSGDPSYREILARARQAWMPAVTNRIPLLHISRICKRDFFEGEGLICDVEFNYVADLQATGLGGQGSDVITDSAFEALRIPFTARRFLATRRVLISPWVLFLGNDDTGGLSGTILAQEGTASSDTLARLGSAVADAFAQVAADPDQSVTVRSSDPRRIPFR